MATKGRYLDEWSFGEYVAFAFFMLMVLAFIVSILVSVKGDNKLIEEQNNSCFSISKECQVVYSRDRQRYNCWCPNASGEMVIKKFL